MNTEWGRWQVVGTREYRGNRPGAVFIESLERNAARRAVARGDIKLIEMVTPELPPEWGLPAGWSSRKEQG
jgi:hypothetical protein